MPPKRSSSNNNKQQNSQQQQQQQQQPRQQALDEDSCGSIQLVMNNTNAENESINQSPQLSPRNKKIEQNENTDQQQDIPPPLRADDQDQEKSSSMAFSSVVNNNNNNTDNNNSTRLPTLTEKQQKRLQEQDARINGKLTTQGLGEIAVDNPNRLLAKNNSEKNDNKNNLNGGEIAKTAGTNGNNSNTNFQQRKITDMMKRSGLGMKSSNNNNNNNSFSSFNNNNTNNIVTNFSGLSDMEIFQVQRDQDFQNSSAGRYSYRFLFNDYLIPNVIRYIKARYSQFTTKIKIPDIPNGYSEDERARVLRQFQNQNGNNNMTMMLPSSASAPSSPLTTSSSPSFQQLLRKKPYWFPSVLRDCCATFCSLSAISICALATHLNSLSLILDFEDNASHFLDYLLYLSSWIHQICSKSFQSFKAAKAREPNLQYIRPTINDVSDALRLGSIFQEIRMETPFTVVYYNERLRIRQMLVDMCNGGNCLRGHRQAGETCGYLTISGDYTFVISCLPLTCVGDGFGTEKHDGWCLILMDSHGIIPWANYQGSLTVVSFKPKFNFAQSLQKSGGSSSRNKNRNPPKEWSPLLRGEIEKEKEEERRKAEEKVERMNAEKNSKNFKNNNQNGKKGQSTAPIPPRIRSDTEYLEKLDEKRKSDTAPPTMEFDEGIDHFCQILCSLLEDSRSKNLSNNNNTNQNLNGNNTNNFNNNQQQSSNNNNNNNTRRNPNNKQQNTGPAEVINLDSSDDDEEGNEKKKNALQADAASTNNPASTTPQTRQQNNNQNNNLRPQQQQQQPYVPAQQVPYMTFVPLKVTEHAENIRRAERQKRREQWRVERFQDLKKEKLDALIKEETESRRKARITINVFSNFRNGNNNNNKVNEDSASKQQQQQASPKSSSTGRGRKPAAKNNNSNNNNNSQKEQKEEKKTEQIAASQVSKDSAPAIDKKNEKLSLLPRSSTGVDASLIDDDDDDEAGDLSMIQGFIRNSTASTSTFSANKEKNNDGIKKPFSPKNNNENDQDEVKDTNDERNRNIQDEIYQFALSKLPSDDDIRNLVEEEELLHYSDVADATALEHVKVVNGVHFMKKFEERCDLLLCQLYGNEEQMLELKRATLSILKSRGPPILTGWNMASFFSNSASMNNNNNNNNNQNQNNNNNLSVGGSCNYFMMSGMMNNNNNNNNSSYSAIMGSQNNQSSLSSIEIMNRLARPTDVPDELCYLNRSFVVENLVEYVKLTLLSKEEEERALMIDIAKRKEKEQAAKKAKQELLLLAKQQPQPQTNNSSNSQQQQQQVMNNVKKPTAGGNPKTKSSELPKRRQRKISSDSDDDESDSSDESDSTSSSSSETDSRSDSDAETSDDSSTEIEDDEKLNFDRAIENSKQTCRLQEIEKVLHQHQQQTEIVPRTFLLVPDSQDAAPKETEIINTASKSNNIKGTATKKSAKMASDNNYDINQDDALLSSPFGFLLRNDHDSRENQTKQINNNDNDEADADDDVVPTQILETNTKKSKPKNSTCRNKLEDEQQQQQQHVEVSDNDDADDLVLVEQFGKNDNTASSIKTNNNVKYPTSGESTQELSLLPVNNNNNNNKHNKISSKQPEAIPLQKCASASPKISTSSTTIATSNLRQPLLFQSGFASSTAAPTKQNLNNISNGKQQQEQPPQNEISKKEQEKKKPNGKKSNVADNNQQKLQQDAAEDSSVAIDAPVGGRKGKNNSNSKQSQEVGPNKPSNSANVTSNNIIVAEINNQNEDSVVAVLGVEREAPPKASSLEMLLQNTTTATTTTTTTSTTTTTKDAKNDETNNSTAATKTKYMVPNFKPPRQITTNTNNNDSQKNNNIDHSIVQPEPKSVPVAPQNNKIVKVKAPPRMTNGGQQSAPTTTVQNNHHHLLNNGGSRLGLSVDALLQHGIKQGNDNNTNGTTTTTMIAVPTAGASNVSSSTTNGNNRQRSNHSNNNNQVLQQAKVQNQQKKELQQQQQNNNNNNINHGGPSLSGTMNALNKAMGKNANSDNNAAAIDSSTPGSMVLPPGLLPNRASLKMSNQIHALKKK